MYHKICATTLLRTILTAMLVFTASFAFAQNKKPNILVIMGDDIGWYNTSIYNRGDMGYQTPNIDRIVIHPCHLRRHSFSKLALRIGVVS
jgi:hypothetical protein